MSEMADGNGEERDWLAVPRAAENESSNDERDALVRELEEVSIQKKQMEKREKDELLKALEAQR